MRHIVLLALVACGAPQAEPVTPQAPSSATVVVDAAPPEKKPVLAKSSSTTPAPTSGLDVVVTPAEVRVAGKPIHAAAFADTVAKSGEHEALLSVAPDVGYRTLVEVLSSLGQSEIDGFHLLVEGPNGKSTIDVDAPRSPLRADSVSGASRRVPTLNLSIFIVADGISIKTSAANLAPGCNSTGAGLAIPKRDFEALAACVAKAKSAGPFASEDTATITANPDVDFQTLVHAIDAIRPSFPSVRFGVAR